MAKRRDVIIGAGALAFGSGAMSVNAAFSDSVDPGGDFRVISAADLTVEPGIAFRTGSNPSDPYNTSLAGSNDLYAQSNSDFFADDNPTNDTKDDLGQDLTLSEVPAISVSDDVDGSLVVKIATLATSSTYTFEDVLQVRNDGDTTQDIGVKFAVFGADTDGPQEQNGGQVDEHEVVGSYSFIDESNSRISTDETDYEGLDTSNTLPQDQTVDNTVSISPGAVEQIDIEVSLTSDALTQVRSAASISGGTPFSGDLDTVQMVDTIRFGTGADSTT